MAKSFSLAEGLRESLLRALSTPPSLRDINRLIQVCHTLALTTLRQRIAGRFASELHGISPAQLAYDCIADLFIRNKNGQLFRLTSYFEAFQPEKLADGEVLQHFRRLVGGTVHQALCRVYTEIDPTLGKILRNLKLAVQSLGHFKQVDQFGEPCIAPVFCDPLDHLSACPFEELERGILAHAIRMRTVPDLLSALSLYIRDQSECSRVVSIVDVARVFRSIFSRLADSETLVESDSVDEIAHHDVHATIAWACDQVQTKMARAYVSGGKISHETAAMYRNTIEQYLRGKLDGDGEQVSLRAQFSDMYPGIAKTEYMLVHRSRLEYMTRLAEELVYERLRA